MIKTFLKHVIYETAIDVAFSNILRSFNKPNGYNIDRIESLKNIQGDLTWMAVLKKNGLETWIDLGFTNGRRTNGAIFTFDVLDDLIAVHGDELGNELFNGLCRERVEELL
jgi:hypothetical protein